MRSIGQATGFHYTTVSLALRNDPQIPARTAKIIQEAAKKLGYRPDPMLKALSAYRLSERPQADHGVLAWISNTATPTWTRADFNFATYLTGARKRAEELGYRLEEFLLRAPGMTAKRMGRVLRARGIRGVLVAPQPWGSVPTRIEMDWEPFSAVVFGYSLEWPQLDLVADHHMDSVRIAIRELQKRGYQRIGLYLSEEVDRRSNGGLVGGFLTEMFRQPRKSQVFPLIYKTWEGGEFLHWVRRERMDGVILQGPNEVSYALAELKTDVPEKIGLVSLHTSRRGYAIVSQPGEEIGIKAVDLVVGMINTNRRGIPAVPSRVLMKSTWHEGTTVRREASVAQGAGVP